MYMYTLDSAIRLRGDESLVSTILLIVVSNGIPLGNVERRMTQQLVGMLQSIQGELVCDALGVVVCLVHLVWFLAGIYSEQEAIRWRQDIGKLLDEANSFVAGEIADAGSQGQHNFGTG